MSHIPNISFREAVGLGNVGTLGQSDPAAPDNPLFPLRTPGTADRCSALDASRPSALSLYSSPDDVRLILWASFFGGQAAQAAQAYRLPTAQGTPGKITQQDFVNAAGDLKCEVAAVKAVAEVEARGSGFLGDGRPKILFEAHHFSRFTKRVYDKLYPNISSSTWKKDLYLGGAKEYDRLNEAIKLDAKSAIQSASWGAFQIMGFNYQSAGFTSPEDYVAAMYKGEGEHLKAFVSFVKSMKLAKHIQTKSWEAFAKAYNGPKYKDNDYDGKLAKAYAKHAAPPAGASSAAKPKAAGEGKPKT